MMLKQSFICCYITCITVLLNLEYISFITLLTINYSFSKLEPRFSEETIEMLMSTLTSLTPFKKCSKLKSWWTKILAAS